MAQRAADDYVKGCRDYMRKKENAMVRDLEYMNNLGEAARQYSHPELISCETTKTLLTMMPVNMFFSPLDWWLFYGRRMHKMDLPLPVNELRELLNEPCPFTFGGEEPIKNTHFLFCLPDRKRFTVKKWSMLHPPGSYLCAVSNYYMGDGSYFTKTEPRFDWYLMHTRRTLNNGQKSWEKRLGSLQELGYDVPLACELTALHCLYFSKNRYRIEDFPPHHGSTMARNSVCNIPDTAIITTDNEYNPSFEAAIFIYDILRYIYDLNFSYSHVEGGRDQAHHDVYAFRKL